MIFNLKKLTKFPDTKTQLHTLIQTHSRTHQVKREVKIKSIKSRKKKQWLVFTQIDLLINDLLWSLVLFDQKKNEWVNKTEAKLEEQ